MKVEFDYDQGRVGLVIPDDNLLGVLTIPTHEALPDPDAAVRTALEKPIGSPPLLQVAAGCKDACVVVSDVTRPVPNQLILPPVLDVLEEAGIPGERVTILVGTGAHRPNEGEELEQLLGREVLGRVGNVVNHIARDEAKTCIYLGDTPNGTPIHINKVYMESDLKILTGLVEPHFMAGFSGGAKAICPGISGISTLASQHGVKFLAHEKAAVGVVEGNPFADELRAVASAAPADFIVNVSIDANRDPISVFAGDMEEAHRAAWTFLMDAGAVPVSELADAVITSSAGFPLDTTLYQSVKAMVGAMEVVKQDGTIFVLSGCKEGIGSEEFAEGLCAADSIEECMDVICKPGYFKIDQWMVQELDKAKRHAEILYYTDGIDAGELRRAHVEPVSSPEEGLERILERHGKNAKIYAIPQGPYVHAVYRPDSD